MCVCCLSIEEETLIPFDFIVYLLIISYHPLFFKERHSRRENYLTHTFDLFLIFHFFILNFVYFSFFDFIPIVSEEIDEVSPDLLRNVHFLAGISRNPEHLSRCGVQTARVVVTIR